MTQFYILNIATTFLLSNSDKKTNDIFFIVANAIDIARKEIAIFMGSQIKSNLFLVYHLFKSHYRISENDYHNCSTVKKNTFSITNSKVTQENKGFTGIPLTNLKLTNNHSFYFTNYSESNAYMSATIDNFVNITKQRAILINSYIKIH